jgi:HK97 family phage major capsid protein
MDTDAPGWSDLAVAARDSARSTPSERLNRVLAFQNAMSERVPSGGGFLVGEALRGDLMQATLEQAIIRPSATVLPVSTLRTGIPQIDDTTHAAGAVLGGVTWAWAEEGSALSPSAPAYGRLVLEVKKLAVYLGGVPDELVEDAEAFGVFARTSLASGQAWAEDQAFIAGSGTGQPQGILNAPCAVSVSRTTSLQADVAAMVTRMLPQSFKYCIWLCSPDLTSSLLNMFTQIGTTPTSAVTAPSAWLTGNPDDGWTLLGRPVHFTEHVPASGTRGDLILVDPRFYVIADRQLMTIDSSSLGQKFPQDQTEYRVISRKDGRIWLQSPVTPQNSSATVSPVVIRN